jgi:hypothetical protein
MRARVRVRAHVQVETYMEKAMPEKTYPRLTYRPPTYRPPTYRPPTYRPPTGPLVHEGAGRAIGEA